ncbi:MULTISPECIES: C40 family peptidase [unclassified Plantactinospora]|uniref:C40 family peptidase n=1 Tax=unclassified Plantactinospora TaxID=2631981 RepID=UPI000D177C20|nr:MULTISPECIES: C40 family peptidase [unclassified Plantactinospora]AVT31601.1 glycoside hydrolase [Plantactinospora sp. BC1]AVT38732.1 glycoside hydrolase [Plantactinospora sp. BB1]
MSSVRILLRTLVAAGLSAALLAPMSAARAEPSAGELTQRINKASAELEQVVESYNKLNEEIKESKAAAATLSARIGPLQQQADQSRAEVAELASRAYKLGGLSTASALLNRGDANTLVNRLGALEQLARDRDRQIAGFEATQRQYTEEKARLDATLARQTAQAKQLAAGKKRIEGELAKLYEMRREAYGSATSSGSRYTGSVPAVSGKAGVAVRYAYGAIGKPYVWAAEGPNGYDCSGLTLAAWRAAGKSLPHNAAMQWDRVAHIGRGELKPGDLVFYSGLGHVALFVGSGKVIHAPRAGESVKLADVDMMNPYGYGRVR